MQKNVAGQTWTVFAFDRTDNTPKTGDSAQITAKLSKDGAAGAATNDVNPTELESGYYEFTLTQAETNYDKLTIIPVSSTGDIQVVGSPGTIFLTPAGFPDDVMVGTDGANTVVPMSDADSTTEHGITQNAIGNLQDFDPDLDAVANVTLVATTTTNTDMVSEPPAMVGTDNAALAIVCTETRLAELDAGNLPTDIAAIPTTMVGTDNAATETKQDAGDVVRDRISDIQEADRIINFTGGTLTYKTKGTATVLLTKNLIDPDDVAVNSTEDVIAAEENV